jgi:2,3-diketo-5-methylthio-1-phosphopentane phosphatase
MIDMHHTRRIPQRNASQWTVLCDFDGTIAVDDVTDSLLLCFGRPGWEMLEAAWRDGRIDARACMSAQVALLACTRAELDAHLALTDIDPDFAAFAGETQRLGMRLAIVSDGLDYACRAILDSRGLGHLPIIANRLVGMGTRRWRLDFPHAREGCRVGSGTCKCAFAPLGDGPVLLIGDGASDFCPAERATFVFARKRLLAHCRELGLPHRAVTSFREARALLAELAAVDTARTCA